jgi:hypothetical protein
MMIPRSEADGFATSTITGETWAIYSIATIGSIPKIN